MGVSLYAPVAFVLLTWECDALGCEERWDSVNPGPADRVRGAPNWQRVGTRVLCPEHKEGSDGSTRP
jgi:hypothetical protein